MGSCMTKRFDHETFRRVFSDAHVIDLDFSEWDKWISLWALADHYENWVSRCPCVVVEFQGVTEFSLRLPKHDLVPESPNEHLQWNIYEFAADDSGSALHFRFSGSPSSPVLQIECDSVNIRAVPIETLDAVCPGWSRPFAPFARPGIAELFEGMASKRGRR